MDKSTNYEIRRFNDPSGTENVEFIAKNDHLGIKMQVCPPFLAREDTHAIEWQKNELEIVFLDDKGKLIMPLEHYIITKFDIPNLDADNKELLEEIFAKYAAKFSTVTEYKNFSDLISQIFVDIEEKREQKISQ